MADQTENNSNSPKSEDTSNTPASGSGTGKENPYDSDNTSPNEMPDRGAASTSAGSQSSSDQQREGMGEDEAASSDVETSGS